jgi:hypothetical protein
MEIAVFLIVILGAVGAFIWQQTKTKGRWGIGSLSSRNCPRCAAPLPIFRKPASASQMMWGGWTRPQCGCKIDKYEQEIKA